MKQHIPTSPNDPAEIYNRLGRIGIAVPEILVPGPEMAPERWAVIACDQFSSEKSYWEETRRIVGDSPSTLDLIIPECYLEDGDRNVRAEAANTAMADVVDRGILRSLEPGFILVNRSTAHVANRQGLVIAVDLEAYDFAEGSGSPIRPTEGTIRDRLPPRMAVRREARLDLPHILILINDPENRVMSAAQAAAGETVYDFDLMQGGGHITGRHIAAASASGLAGAFESLAGESDLLFAVGDGNHSLATAREIWMEKKAAGAPEDHPARFALVEVENIHDDGLPFHPIHRILFGVNPDELAGYLKNTLGASPAAGGVVDVGKGASNDVIRVIGPGLDETWRIEVPAGRLAVEPLQAALDSWLTGRTDATIDYIHGEEAVRDLAGSGGDRLGIILPELDKSAFFSRITDIGPYPRKTFSIGEAVEKRYYLEARKLA